ncbi:hypothetical protein EDE15_3249 [Edaphobacter aggregans]|uniref:Uncharacterized protein n=1 Tax=Edaphobacter aggregans TaxID=570835 RepID=A0A3R9NYJ6_9BACT|nr:hypothetical protein [Edaphobacter aggregans]RSL17710.1 hypothetical protein EDE15_3249 [Edaphobacter aggregans]
MGKFAPNDNYLSRCFTATCAVGRAVRNNWSQLIDATQNYDFDWESLVKYLDQSCISQFSSIPVSNDFRSYTDHVRDSLRSIHRGFLKDYPLLQDVVLLIIDGIIDWADVNELEEHLMELNKEGRDRAIECVKRWGGPLAKKRLESLRSADLEVSENGHTGATYTYMPTPTGSVRLAFGHPRGSLLSYLNLDFYFFHEYLSHIFPAWDDRARDFSEGYLFQVAHWESVITAATAAKILIWNLDFAQHAETVGVRPGDEGRWVKMQVTAQWYREKRCQDAFPSMLLELAAFHDPQNPNFGPKFIRYLRWIARTSDENAQNKILSAIQEFSGDLVSVSDMMRQYTIDKIQ